MLSFRRHKREDISYRVAWLNNRAAALYVYGTVDHLTTEAEQTAWFDQYEKEATAGLKKFFTIMAENKPIGFMGLFKIDPIKRSAKIFILIGDEEYRGQGLGREALQHLIQVAKTELDLKTLYLEVHKKNLPAIKLYRRLGFKSLDKPVGDEMRMTYSWPG